MTRIDPLRAFVSGAFNLRDRRPIPLTDTRFEVEIRAGLALVRTSRTFRNVEPDPIEATITFPVPVEAQMFDLEAVIGGRRLVGQARAKAAAREAYEDAIDRGKPAVLHEEVLKGVHKLSVANIAPGAEVAVGAAWVASLSLVDGAGRLRIPLTVGQIYGRSGLEEVDEMVSGGPASMARLTVRCETGPVELVGGALSEGAAFVRLNAPIDLKLPRWTPGELEGLSQDGRAIAVSFEAAAGADRSLDVAILVDRSGSMHERADADRPRAGSKHQAVVRALGKFAMAGADRFDLWQFNHETAHIGASTPGTPWRRSLAGLAARLAGPEGGTEIGEALDAVIAGSTARDILLITDGKSHALDPHRPARSGRRISVLLVGADSLEARVGHLAGLTGGAVLVAAGDDIAAFLGAALDGLRAGQIREAIEGGARESRRLTRNGLRIEARWSAEPSALRPAGFARAVSAFAAGLALPDLPAAEAAALAAAEGLVTDLTSLVLVDEASEALEGLPATRKVALSAPEDSWGDVVFCAMEEDAGPRAEVLYGSMGRDRQPDAPSFLRRLSPGSRPPPAAARERAAREARRRLPTLDELIATAAQIDWNQAPNRLLEGDLSQLPPRLAERLADWAADDDLVDLAAALGVEPIRLLLALVASLRPSDPTACRLARTLATPEQIEALSLLIETAD
jgi:hypothetical protein